MNRIVLFLLFFVATGMKAQTLPTVEIVYNGTKATVSVPSEIASSITSNVSGSTVSITSSTQATEYCYRVSGTSSNGSLTITGSYKLTLELAGVNLTNPNGAAIDIECGKRIAVVLADGTVNTLADGSGGTQKAAVYFAGHPEFEGGGTLNVTGHTKHAISAKEYLELKSSTGTINVLGAVSDGIHCGKGKVNNEKNYFEMKGGVVNISGVGSDCIDSDDYGCMYLKGGTLNLAVTTDGGCALKCDSLLTMTGGDLNITLSASDADGIRCNYAAYLQGGDIRVTNTGAGSKAIKLKNVAAGTTSTVVDGGYAYFQGTDVSVALSGDNYTDGGRCMAFSVDKDMEVIAGKLLVQTLGQQVKAYNVKGNLNVKGGGVLMQEGKHNLLDAHDFEYDQSLYFIIQRNGVQLADYANYQLTAHNQAGDLRGVADFYMVDGNVLYGYLRLYSNTAGESITFQLYDASDSQTYPCNETLTFTADGREGTPSSPYILSFNAESNTFTVTASATPSDGGTVTGNGTYEEGTSVTLVATAAKGYRFSCWNIREGQGWKQYSTDATITFTVQSDCELQAVFEVDDPITITARSYYIDYGEAIPTFDYYTTGNPLRGGEPTLSCEAVVGSPAGVYPITVDASKVENTEVKTVEGKLTIRKVSLTMRAVDLTMTQGDEVPPLQLEYEGFILGDTEETAFTELPTLKTTATSSSPAGTYTIRVSGGKATNYSLTRVNGTLTIQPANGINETFASERNDKGSVIHDLSGRKINAGAYETTKLKKGIYLVNGKKMLIK